MDWSLPPRPALRPAAFIGPCIPTVAATPPTGPAWVHEIKHDGYRLMVWRDGDRVRLFTRRGFDWTDRYPRIVHAASRLPVTRFLIDGEAVVCGEDGVTDFARLHSREHDSSVFLYAFDLLAVDGTDLRHERLDDRRATLGEQITTPGKLEAAGIRLSESLDGDGETMFRHACKLGLEGIVSKRRDAPYRSGRSKTWLKVKNPDSAAMRRLEDVAW
jgi:ATP-dependent DNA ligase